MYFDRQKHLRTPAHPDGTFPIPGFEWPSRVNVSAAEIRLQFDPEICPVQPQDRVDHVLLLEYHYWLPTTEKPWAWNSMQGILQPLPLSTHGEVIFKALLPNANPEQDRLKIQVVRLTPDFCNWRHSQTEFEGWEMPMCIRVFPKATRIEWEVTSDLKPEWNPYTESPDDQSP